MSSKARRLLLGLVLFLVACGGGQAPAKVVVPVDANVPPARAMPSSPAAVEPSVDALEADTKIPINAEDPQRGGRSALVTIVLFSDFQCPFCARVEPTLDQVRETYGDQVRIVWKDEPLPFHEHAKLAAQVGAAVFALRGPEAFWQFHDMAFRRQQNLSRDAVRAWAVSLGVDANALEAGLERGTWQKKVDADLELAQKVGANGTPAAFVNGISVSGAQPFDKFKEVIDKELAEARKLVGEGASRNSVYRVRVAENFKGVQARTVDDDEKEDTTTVWAVPVGKSPVRGAATALVTIVEFADFQCPYCKRVDATLEQLRTHYGAKVRFVWKDEPLPFHPRALPAAELARYARAQKGDSGFWDVHDRLFASQPQLEDSDFEGIARAAGLDPAAAMKAVNAKAYAATIDADAEVGEDFQASGTPHFFINGRRLVGAQPYDKFTAVIDDEITKAEARVKGGVPAAALYDTIVKTAKGPPEPETKTVAVPANAPFRGPANAKVVVQEFGDFQCPFCGRAEATVEDLLKAYPTQVKVVWRDKPLPMHPQAPLAAEAAREAFAQKGNDGFAKMRKLCFENAHRGGEDGLGRTALEGYAQSIGLDMRRFNLALDNHIHKAAVDADDKAGTDAGISGTPAFIVGPFYLSGAQPLAKFKKLVNRTLNGPPPAPKVAAAPTPTAVSPTLGIVDTVVGTGRAARAGDKAVVHYTGKLADGTEFDSSRKHGKTFEFPLGAGRVIKGWDQGIVGMKIGGQRKLTIPPDLGYGAKGAGAVIPPNATLIFDVELVDLQ